jgi:glucose/arabinose dehydrogenase
MHRRTAPVLLWLALLAAAVVLTVSLVAPASSTLAAAAKVLEGKAAFTDYRQERPGVIRKITAADLPAPYETKSAVNGPRLVPRPANATLETLPGFKVALYAEGLINPRLIRTAPNGDLFVAESAAGRVSVYRGLGPDGRAQKAEVFAGSLTLPFGIAFYPPGPEPKYVYIANTDSVVRFPYVSGDLQARGGRETIVARIPSGGGHWTRDVAFSRDGRTMFVSVGSASNVNDTDGNPAENHRADILAFNPDGSAERVYAYGIRNAVGIAICPQTGQLWASVNERDGLGDNLVPDYITQVREGGFYGWPWFYMGGRQDPRHLGKHPELKDKVLTPDVILQPHLASLEMTFYDGRMFPAQYRNHVFAAEHGSWNRSLRVGYKIIHVPLKDGRATGEYEDFLTGFVTSEGNVWGRPVGVAVAKDGALMLSDDGSNSLWRVSYQGR